MNNLFALNGPKWIVIRTWFITIFILNALTYIISTEKPILLIKLLIHAGIAFIAAYCIWYFGRPKDQGNPLNETSK